MAVGVPTSDAPDGPVTLRTLRLQPSAPDRTDAAVTLVLDTTWLPRAGPGPRAAIEAAHAVLSRVDVIEEAADLLEDWATASGVVSLLSIEDTSSWYYDRLVHAKWLQSTILWLRIIASVVDDEQVEAVTCTADVPKPIVETARLVAEARGLPFEALQPPAPPVTGRRRRSKRSGGKGRRWRRIVRSFRRRLVTARERFRPDATGRRQRLVRQRLNRLAGERDRRLLVLLQHARQRIDLPGGPVWMNPYLGPVVERVRGTRLEPIELDLRLSIDEDDPWRANANPRSLPREAVDIQDQPSDAALATVAADAVAESVGRIDRPMVVDGVDLGPIMTARAVEQARRTMKRMSVTVGRIRRLLRTLHPAGILLTVEYNRPEWLAAARCEGIPVAALQHGIIHRGHGGYAFRSRPAQLTLPERTYVFGGWERDVLVQSSAFREHEVIVSGSPRLDLVQPGEADGNQVRAELGVDPADRMVVVSGTWGASYREFYIPIALARLVDRPLPNVHLVIKLHPGEPDEGPYRTVIERAAAAGGFAPPPVTVVQAIDLYRLLAAADAHFGIHSTVLTEAVAAGTFNLIAGMFAGYDLLDYVGAGVAVPIADGGDLLAALDRRAELLPSEAARTAFLEAHFRPGQASDRIAADLLDWLAMNGSHT